MTTNKRQRKSVASLRRELQEVTEQLKTVAAEPFAEYLRLRQQIADYEAAGEDAPYLGIQSTQKALDMAFDLIGDGPHTKDVLFEELYDGALPRARAEGGKNSIMSSLGRLCREGRLEHDNVAGGAGKVWRTKRLGE